MKRHFLRPLTLTAIYLVALECALEVRAYHRGWETLLFGTGQHPTVHASPVQPEQTVAFGPDEDFPFRSPKVDPDVPANTVRYWLASSSLAEDLSLEPAALFPNRLTEFLIATDVPCQMLNASKAGMQVPDNVEQLSTLGPEWQPHVTILYQLSNDLNILIGQLQPTRSGAEPASAEGPATPRYVVDAASRLIEHTVIYALVRANVTSRLTRTKQLADTLAPEGRQEFAARVRRFVYTSRRLGAEPVLCTVATSHTDPAALPSRSALTLFRYQESLSLRGYFAAVEVFNDTLRSVAEEEHVLLVDVAAKLSGRSALFKDFVHVTPEGHEAVARILAEALAEHPPTARLAQAAQRGKEDE